MIMSDQDSNQESNDPGHSLRLHSAPSAGATVMPSGSRTQTVTLEETQSVPAVHLKLKKPKKKKRVGWTEETVDNEGMGKRKSKCCCIYKKPQAFGESSDSSDDDDCEDCGGHKHNHNGNSNNNNSEDPPPSTVS